jgi:hypothetical protein
MSQVTRAVIEVGQPLKAIDRLWEEALGMMAGLGSFWQEVKSNSSHSVSILPFPFDPGVLLR